MGVSRPSIREAVKLLELQGMIETVQGGGTIVRNLAAQEIQTPIAALLDADKEKSWNSPMSGPYWKCGAQTRRVQPD